MTSILGVGVAVGGGVGALGGVLRGRPDQLLVRRLTDQRVLDGASPAGTAAMLVNATLACRITPPSI